MSEKFISAIIYDNYISWSCDDGRIGRDPYAGADPFGHLCDRFPECHVETHDERTNNKPSNKMPDWTRTLIPKFQFLVTFERSTEPLTIYADSFTEALKDPRVVSRSLPVSVIRVHTGESDE